MEVMDYQWERIVEALKECGFTGKQTRFVRTTKHDIKVPFRMELKLNEHDNITDLSSAVLYATEAYPVTGKEEAVLRVYDLAGFNNKGIAKRVVDKLAKRGVAARVTTYKKDIVVAFDAGDWLNIACGK